ncbi:MAG: DUF86 domain-containing protein [Magnetococcales bacterium]|nr:DUF86 domain-containing protein [Magnetococcales bacterium]
MSEILLNKVASIQRCLHQVRDYDARPSDVPFEADHFKQDAIAANVQRACEQCIDLANHVVRLRKLGWPKESRESFRLLADAGLIPQELAGRLGRMVGFRNLLVHQYQPLDIGLLREVIDHRLEDLMTFTEILVRQDVDESAIQ